MQRRWFGTALWRARRYGNATRAAVRDGRVDGVAVCFDGEDYPPPTVVDAAAEWPFVLGGPRVMARAAAMGGVMTRHHPHEPHLYLWLLAAHPDAQRRGVGRALLDDVIAEARARELPVYLETFTPGNVPYYASFGFGIDEVHEDVTRGATLWRMTRPLRA